MFVTAAAAKAVFCQIQCLHDHRFLCRVDCVWCERFALSHTIRIPQAFSIMHISEVLTQQAAVAVCVKMQKHKAAALSCSLRLLPLIFSLACVRIITVRLEMRWLGSTGTTQAEIIPLI